MEHSVTLRGEHVVLEPLRVEHAEALLRAVAPDDDVWSWMNAEPRTLDEMRAWVTARIAGRPAGQAWAFVQRDPATGAVMGSTSLFDVSEEAESGEIGFTWLAAPYRRSGANTEAKRLLLEFAFESLRLRRVQLVTDARNLRSQNAIARLGATREGTLRYVRRSKDGKLRDSVVFSILDREWPEIKARLSALSRPPARP